MIFKKSRNFIIALCICLLSASSASAIDSLSPGTITDTDITTTDTAFTDSGVYAIQNANNNVLNLTADKAVFGTLGKAGESIVVNGGLNVLSKFTGSSNIGVTLNNVDASVTVNGDFIFNADYANKNRGNQFAVNAGTLNLNGNVDFKYVTDSTFSQGSYNENVTLFIANGKNSTINIGAEGKDVSIYSKVNAAALAGINTVYATDGGTINITGSNIFLQGISDKPDVISAKRLGTVNFNSSGNTQIIGNVDFTNGSKSEGGTVSGVLSGSDSFWYGDEMNYSQKRLKLGSVSGNMDLVFKNGATWIYFGFPDMFYDSEGTQAHDRYSDSKEISRLTLEDGGTVNMYDYYAKQKWAEYGLEEQYPGIGDIKHDYVVIRDLRGSKGIFQLDINASDKSQSDMVYVMDSQSGAGNHYLQAYDVNGSLPTITPTNTVRFATVAEAAKDKITFSDMKNIYNKSLWDYELLIGSSAYDASDSQNAVYNQKLVDDEIRGEDGNALTLDDINTLFDGGMNWYIYKYLKVPSATVVASLGQGQAAYDIATQMDDLNKRLGQSTYLYAKDEGLWFRFQRAGIGIQDAYTGNYSMYQLGYDWINKHTRQNRIGIAYDYLKSNERMMGVTAAGENKRNQFTIYDTANFDNGGYLDIVGKVSHIKSSYEGWNQNGADVSGMYNFNAYSLSAEYGRMFDIGKEKAWFVEPQAQLQYTHLNSGSYTTANGIDVYADSADNLYGRLGVRLGYQTGAKEDFNEHLFYAKFDVLHQFTGGQDYYLSTGDETIKEEVGNRSTWYVYGIGADLRISRTSYCFFDLEKAFGGDTKNTWQFNLGLRWDL